MRINPILRLVAAIFLLLSNSAGAEPLSDFEDGTAQGWALDPSSSPNSFSVVAAGNPGFALQSFDFEGGPPEIVVNAPSEFTGDLSMFEGIQWDEYFIAPAVQATSVFLHGSNGTSYRSESASEGFPTGAWRTRFSAFVASEWTLCTNPDFTCLSGTGSFSHVVSDVQRLSINFEVSSSIGPDSRMDNIQFVEHSVPAMSSPGRLLLIALSGFSAIWMLQRGTWTARA